MPQSQSPHRHRQKLACASASADRDQQHITHRAPNLKKSSSTTCASFQSFHTNHITYSHNHNDDTNANTNANDDDDNHSIAASEDSNPIIWEDDAGTDLRHLFTRRDANANNSEDNNGAPQLLPTMTQQVDEMMLHMDDSDDSDNDCSDGINDTKGHAKSDADAGNNSNSNYTNYTPPAAAAATRSKKQKYKLVSCDPSLSCDYCVINDLRGRFFGSHIHMYRLSGCGGLRRSFFREGLGRAVVVIY